MAFTFGWFVDAGLTTEKTDPLTVTQQSDGSTGPVDNVLYFGSNSDTTKVQADSNPGIDNVEVQVGDTAPGSGHETTEVRLATTLAGLDVATPGGSLILGTEVLGGVSNAVEVYIRYEDGTGQVGTTIELFIETNELLEVDQ